MGALTQKKWLQFRRRASKQEGFDYNEYWHESMAGNMLDIIIKPEDVADSVLYLVNDKARYITV